MCVKQWKLKFYHLHSSNRFCFFQGCRLFSLICVSSSNQLRPSRFCAVSLLPVFTETYEGSFILTWFCQGVFIYTAELQPARWFIYFHHVHPGRYLDCLIGAGLTRSLMFKWAETNARVGSLNQRPRKLHYWIRTFSVYPIINTIIFLPSHCMQAPLTVLQLWSTSDWLCIRTETVGDWGFVVWLIVALTGYQPHKPLRLEMAKHKS